MGLNEVEVKMRKEKGEIVLDDDEDRDATEGQLLMVSAVLMSNVRNASESDDDDGNVEEQVVTQMRDDERPILRR